MIIYSSYITAMIIIGLINFIIITIALSWYIYNKSMLVRHKINGRVFNQIVTIMPWIYKQIERSTSHILTNNRFDIINGKATSNINHAQYMELISNIRTHFYGSVPKSITKDILFQYIDSRQIDILIVDEFLKINEGYIKITNPITVDTEDLSYQSGSNYTAQ